MKKRKCRTGTGMSGTPLSSYIPSPDETLADYQIMSQKAELEAKSNPLAIGIQTITPIIQSFLSSGAIPMGGKPATPAPAKAAFGQSEEQVEVEGGEVLQAPGQPPMEAVGPSHDQGGIDLTLPPETQVFAEKVQGADGKSMAERKKARELKRKTFLDLLESNAGDAPTINSAKRRILQLEAEEQEDLQLQEVAGAFANLLGLPHSETAEGEEEVAAYGRRNKKLAFGTPPFGSARFKKNPYTDPENFNSETIKNVQSSLGVEADGIWGPISQKAWNEHQYKTLKPDVKPTKDYEVPWKSKEPTAGTYKNLGLTPEGKRYVGPDVPFLDGQDFSGGIGFDPTAISFEGEDGFDMTAGQDWAKANPLPEGMSEPVPTEIGFKPAYPMAEKSATDGETAPKKEPYMPTAGDFTKLAGNVFSAVAPLLNTLENRAGDTPHPNQFKDVGAEAIQTLDNLEGDASAMKDLQMQKSRSNAASARRRTRGSARGLNTMRALDLVLEMGVNQADLDIMNNFLNARMNIGQQKAGTQMQASQAKAQGAALARDNNDKDRDQFFTNKGQNLANIGLAIQQTGKDLNQIQQNPVQLALIEAMSEYFYVTPKGELKAKKNK